MTAALGKWHLTPDTQQGSGGPFNRWPSGLGFDYFWGFLGGEAGQFDPLITENQKTIGVPEGKDGEPYYFPDDLSEKTIEWLHRVRAEKPGTPWFAYYATGCSHAPHHVPREWADKYAGKFDEGWDVLREKTLARQKELGVVPPDAELPPRNDGFPTWDSLSETERRLYARQMETYAGYSENADWNVGRVLDAIEEMGELENTVVIWIWGDNGASMEGTLGNVQRDDHAERDSATPEQQMGLLFKHGGLEAWGGDLMAPHYSAAWAWASNCPFDWGKQVASHLGGTRDPLVVHYLKGISDAGSLREHFTHVIDIAPTVLELGGSPRRRTSTERAGAAARLHVRRLAGRCRRTRAAHPAVLRGRREQGHVQGRLVARDAAAAHPLAARPRGAAPVRARLGPGRRPGRALLPARRLRPGEEPGRTASGQGRGASKLFWAEATYQVLPILGGPSSFYGVVSPIPKDSTFTYRGKDRERCGRDDPASTTTRPMISADLAVPEEGAEGVIVAAFDHLGGFSPTFRTKFGTTTRCSACSSTRKRPRRRSLGGRQRRDGLRGGCTQACDCR